MINVLIVDDEFFIRKRLRKIIPWEKLNLVCIGEAENGEQVLEYLNNYPIDIVLLDIKLPKLTGTEVAQYIREHYPNIHTIILSGYDDFEYAQAAIRAGVKEYLLKPIQEKELIDALDICINSLQKKRDTKNEIDKLKKYECVRTIVQVREEYLSLENLYDKYPVFRKYEYSIYCGLYFELSPVNLMKELGEKIEKIGIYNVYFQESEYICILQLFLQNKTDIQKLYVLMEKYAKELEHYLFFYVDDVFRLEERWFDYYKRTLYSVSQRYFYDYHLLTKPNENKKIDYMQEKESLLNIRKNIISFLNSKKLSLLEKYIDELFRQILEKKDSNYLHLVMTEIFTIYHIYFQVPEQLNQTIPEWVETMLVSEYMLDMLKNEVMFYGKQCLEKLDSVPSDIALYNKINEYIKENYMKVDLSVSEIAEKFGMTVSYLGSVYKKINNESISQYISNVRIEQAKRLLRETDLKIGEIAEKVGYGDVYYFSKKFKKSCGCSPKSYIDIECATKKPFTNSKGE